MTRLCSMVGVRLSAAAASQARADPCGFLFVRSDVEGMEALVRTASRDSYARGTLLTLEGVRMRVCEHAIAMFVVLTWCVCSQTEE